MFKNEYTLSVDIKKSMSAIVPTFVQYDNASLVFRIYDNGKPFDLTSFTSAEVSHKRSDGTLVIGYGSLETLPDNTKIIRYTYQGNEMSVPGFVSTSLSLYSADKKVSILPFKVEIVGDTYEETIGSNPEVGILQQLITSVAGVSGQATQAVAQANIAVNNAQAIADNTRSVGVFSLSTAYQKNNIVTSNGSSWIALVNTQNNPLPTLPTIQNTWWRLLAQKGADGTGGTGVAVVDASTTEKGIVQLNNTLTSTSTSQAVTAAQAKILNDNLTSHIQDTTKKHIEIVDTTPTNLTGKGVFFKRTGSGSSTPPIRDGGSGGDSGGGSGNGAISIFKSVKEFGAVGNGTIDDTVALQNALDFMAVNKGTLFFPKGTYRISSSLILKLRDVVLRGELGTAIYATGNFIALDMTKHNNRFIKIVDLEIRGNNKQGIGIAIGNVEQYIFTMDSEFQNIHINSFNIGLQLIFCWKVHFYSLYTLYNNTGAIVSGGSISFYNYNTEQNDLGTLVDGGSSAFYSMCNEGNREYMHIVGGNVVLENPYFERLVEENGVPYIRCGTGNSTVESFLALGGSLAYESFIYVDKVKKFKWLSPPSNIQFEITDNCRSYYIDDFENENYYANSAISSYFKTHKRRKTGLVLGTKLTNINLGAYGTNTNIPCDISRKGLIQLSTSHVNGYSYTSNGKLQLTHNRNASNVVSSLKILIDKTLLDENTDYSLVIDNEYISSNVESVGLSINSVSNSNVRTNLFSHTAPATAHIDINKYQKSSTIVIPIKSNLIKQRVQATGVTEQNYVKLEIDITFRCTSLALNSPNYYHPSQIINSISLHYSEGSLKAHDYIYTSSPSKEIVSDSLVLKTESGDYKQITLTNAGSFTGVETRLNLYDSLPTASESLRGHIILLKGGNNTADSAYFCAKNSNNSYAWVQL